jgi:hypothetical protein
MENVVSFQDKRNKVASSSLMIIAKQMDQLIGQGLSAQHVSGAEVAGVLAQRMGAFMRLFDDNKANILRVVVDIMSKETFRVPAKLD